MIVPVTYPASEFHPTISPALNLADIHSPGSFLDSFASIEIGSLEQTYLFHVSLQ